MCGRRDAQARLEIWTSRHVWTGHVTAETGGEFIATSESDDGIRVWIDGKSVIDDWTDHASTTEVAHVHLAAGKHELKVEYYQGTGEAIARFGLVELDKIKNNPALNGALETADAVVIGVGFNSGSEGEGHDRSFNLPYEQGLLLDAVTARSKKVILVVNSGAGVNLAPWVGKVSAILEAWYPGQEGATALAEIISGDVNPSGKLPTTFPTKLAGTYYANAYPPINHHVAYSEGLLTGYRWFQMPKHQTPMFPFGFGLSYTTFKLSDVKASVGDDAIHVSTAVTNTGKTFGGTEVVQIYVGPKNPGVGEPVKRLHAFSRVRPGHEWDPGHVDATLNYSDSRVGYTGTTAGHQWVLTPGKYVVYVGTSSRDVIPVEVTITKGERFGP